MTDDEALQLCIDTVLAGPDEKRHRQIRAKMEEDPSDAAELCCYILQMKALDLPPWVSPPCWGEDEGNSPTARLVRRLRKHSISIYVPDPLRALAEAGAGNGLA